MNAKESKHFPPHLQPKTLGRSAVRGRTICTGFSCAAMVLVPACTFDTSASNAPLNEERATPENGSPANALIAPRAFSSSIPRDYALVPGGHVHSSCIHEMPNNATMENGQILDENGALVSSVEPCAFPPLLHRTLEGDDSSIRPSFTGWAEDLRQNLPAGATTWNYYLGFITVPPAPTIDEGQTLFYFGGLVTANGADEIVQPVLQWGHSDAGGGSSWAFASWLVGAWTGHSPLVGTSPGHQLETSVRLIDASNVCKLCLFGPHGASCGMRYQWSVGMIDNTTRQTSNGVFTLDPCTGYNEPNTRMYPAVLEEWNTNHCQDPQQVALSSIMIAADQNRTPPTSLVFQPFAPFLETTKANPPSCFYGATTTGNNVTLW